MVASLKNNASFVRSPFGATVRMFRGIGLICLAIWVLPLRAQQAEQPEAFEVHGLFSDHMVLQRGVPIRIYGVGASGTEVTAVLAGDTARGWANRQGAWEVFLPKRSAGGPFELTVSGPRTLQFSDVLIGDVWLCSGQSNMDWPMKKQVVGAEEAIATSGIPRLRLFDVPKEPRFELVEDLSGEARWRVSSPEVVPDFGAIPFFFGRALERDLSVPIGLVLSAYGGSPIEAWTPEWTLAQIPAFEKDLSVQKAKPEVFTRTNHLEMDSARLDYLTAFDRGIKNGWQVGPANCSDWQGLSLPFDLNGIGYGDFDGVLWLACDFELDERQASVGGRLRLGRVDDMAQVWLNGKWLGERRSTGDVTLPVSARALVPGKNRLVVRLIDTGGNGGLDGRRKDFRFETPAGRDIRLEDGWCFHVGTDQEDFPIHNNPLLYQRPSVLYNGMIQPLLGFAYKGVIWYQGESNADRAAQYERLFPLLISDWRTMFNQKELPFLYVQLAAFLPCVADPQEHSWAELREAQRKTLAVRATGMVVTIDVGDADDIHPRQKLPVGERLALQALQKVYGKDSVVADGPLYLSATIRDGKEMVIQFQPSLSPLVAKGGSLKGFAIAGRDRKFHWADARIEGNTVVVSSSHVHHPVAVRYAWAANPVATLFNAAGLPASPFRTDNWPGLTDGKE